MQKYGEISWYIVVNGHIILVRFVSAITGFRLQNHINTDTWNTKNLLSKKEE